MPSWHRQFGSAAVRFPPPSVANNPSPRQPPPTAVHTPQTLWRAESEPCCCKSSSAHTHTHIWTVSTQGPNHSKNIKDMSSGEWNSTIKSRHFCTVCVILQFISKKMPRENKEEEYKRSWEIVPVPLWRLSTNRTKGQSSPGLTGGSHWGRKWNIIGSDSHHTQVPTESWVIALLWDTDLVRMEKKRRCGHTKSCY